MRLLLLLLLVCGVGEAAKPTRQAEEVDHVALAALLIRDGNWDRAAAALGEVDTEAKGVDLARYHALLGLVKMNEGDLSAAEAAFVAALTHGEDIMIRVQLAQVRLNLDAHAEAIATLDGNPEVDTLPSAWVVRSRAEWKRGDHAKGFAALEEGARRFPESDSFDREAVFRLIELQLFREAEIRAVTWLDRSDDPGAWLTLAEAMRQGGNGTGAVTLLEEARLRYPGRVEVLVQLAGTWLAADNPRACGQVLQQAVELDVGYAVEAAECYRRAGALREALYMNSLVPDSTEKARQRLGLAIESADFERVVALEPRLDRLGLLSDDSVAYAVAYAWFMVGDYDRAEALLGRIQDTEVFADGVALRRAMETCREEPAQCL